MLSVVGARPNFMKLAPLARVLAARPGVDHVIVHTGQHYDLEMSAGFFRDLDIPAPQYNLEVGAGTHARQTALIMQRFEPVLTEVRPDAVLVYGDVNSTVAAALVAAKLGCVVGHVEAGVRSRDRTMPEEINRVVTDRLARWLFAPTRDAVRNLGDEGIASDAVHFVGNVMMDELLHVLPRARAQQAPERHGLAPGRYAVATFHRAGNVDDAGRLRSLVDGLAQLASEVPVVFPVHPRTRQRLENVERVPAARGLQLIEPVGYLEMLGLLVDAAVVVTDSGGVQAETSLLGVPCVTARTSTEWEVTLVEGTNRLVEPDGASVARAAREALERGRRNGVAIERWDGRAASRIAGVILDGEAYR